MNMNESIYKNVCIPLSEGTYEIARQLYYALEQELPQLNHKTGLGYMDTLPGYRYESGKIKIPVQTNERQVQTPNRKKGLRAVAARILFELTRRPYFYEAGWEWLTNTAYETTRLTFKTLHIGITVSPRILNRNFYAWDKPILFSFRGVYDPVNDKLYWDRPNNLRAERDVTKLDATIDGANPFMPPYPAPDNNPSWIDSPDSLRKYEDSLAKTITRRPFEFPRTPSEVIKKAEEKAKYEEWFYGKRPEDLPGGDNPDQNPPQDPRPHDSADFKD